MKIFYCLLVIALFASCKSNQLGSYLSQLPDNQIYKLDNCPENANCSLEVMPNSGILLKGDDFNNGYIEIKKAASTLLKYEFKKNEIPNTADSNYSEILFIEINNNDKQLTLKNEELTRVNMIFGRLCFCKETAGYFSVKKGELEVRIHKNMLTLKTVFSLEPIPQIITKINESIVLHK